jgi:hypothetical protein
LVRGGKRKDPKTFGLKAVVNIILIINYIYFKKDVYVIIEFINIQMIQVCNETCRSNRCLENSQFDLLWYWCVGWGRGLYKIIRQDIVGFSLVVGVNLERDLVD